ncbi:hypothetical protein AMELA_G00059210, partial [Ameiurus melas]
GQWVALPPHGSRVPASTLSSGYCLQSFIRSPDVHVGFLQVIQFSSTSRLTHRGHYSHHQHNDKDHNCGHDCRHHTVLFRTLKLTSVPIVRPIVTYDTPAEGNVTLFTNRYMIAQWVRHWTS